MESVSIPDYPLKRHNLAHEWLVDIPNEVLFIPDEIYLIKHSLRGLLDHLAAPFEAIGELMLEKDVEKCIEKIAQIRDDSAFSLQDGEYWLMKPNPLRLDDKKLVEAVKIHKRRLRLLRSSAKKAKAYKELSKLISHECWEKFEAIGPKKVPDGKRFLLQPCRCSLSFVVDPKTYKATDVKLLVDPTAPPKATAKRIVISREIYLNPENGRDEAVRDMHQLIHLARVEYFKKLFPTESIGEVCLPSLCMS